jgi:hypothetical protein
MRKEYDFSKGKRNPYAKQLKQSVTMRVDRTTLEYFKTLAGELDVPYQTLINLYLRDCALNGRRPTMSWRPSRRGVTRRPAQLGGTEPQLRPIPRRRATGG